MMPLFYLCFFLLITLFGSMPLWAQQGDKYQIAAAQLSGLFNTPAEGAQPQDAGVYHLLLSQILQDTGLASQYEIVVLPMKRAKNDFARGQFACYAPGLDTFDAAERQLLPDNLLSSSAFNYATVKVLSRHQQPVVKSAADIHPKAVISVVRGVPVNPQMQRIMDNALKFYLVGSENENLQMLMTGRVDHILVFYPDVLAAYQQLGIKKHFPFDQQYSPLTIRDNLICQPSHKKAFLQIEAAILRYQKQGLLPKILGDYYLAKDFDTAQP